MSARPPRPAASARPLDLLRGWALFVREAIANPRDVGAVVPSSRALARRMARLIDPAGSGPVVELGAGTGVVTEALLQRGVHPRRLVALERSENLADLLHGRFPDIRVICGDAADLRRLLARLNGAYAHHPVHIVSSLPLRSLPPDKVQAIVREIAEVLRPGGEWIQYTYALGRNQVPGGFTRRASSLVWQNVPPARVDVFAPAPVG